MFPVPVTRSVDLSLPMMVVPHDYIGAASTYAKVPGIGLEILLLNIEWFGGMALGKNKVASNVTHRGTGIVQDGNDMGPLIPQISIVVAPDNILSFVHLLTSSCKVTFSAGDVQAQGKPVACIFPLMPMMVCGNPIKVPFGYSVTNVLNTVAIYPHIVDFIAGIASVFAQVLMGVLTSSSPSGAAAGPWDALRSGVIAAILGSAPTGGKVVASQVPGLVTGLVRLVGRLVCDDYQGPVSFGLSYDQGRVLGGGVTYTWGSDGSHTISEEVRTGGGGLYRLNHSDQYSPDGTHTSRTSTRVLQGRGASDSETTITDSEGNVTHTVERSNLHGRDDSETQKTPVGGVLRTGPDADGRDAGRSTRPGVKTI